ncbi:MAG: IS66 family insertion sequence element accessory protein TnpB [Cytophagaceae bacterium]|nr:IS66 family insertion sequence element accessory protein TnpB [Cytophagaceae bacterium]MBK9934120.1 IS66 family insertion sequence element accessory protein TnpB [Cytophagaceae bacterium]MBL0327514.1 IS66 family insertion sequence element accessory protein TnpB [Cytophagaceae bacterium]
MRKGFDGLSGLVRNELGRSPTEGSVFVFVNKQRNQMKLLHWERGGLVLYQKRLEAGRFCLPEKTEKDCHLSWPELVLIVEGISYIGLKKKGGDMIPKKHKNFAFFV